MKERTYDMNMTSGPRIGAALDGIEYPLQTLSIDVVRLVCLRCLWVVWHLGAAITVSVVALNGRLENPGVGQLKLVG